MSVRTLSIAAAAVLLLPSCSVEEQGGLDFAAKQAWPSESLLPPAGGPRLVVTNSGDDTLSFIDPASFTEIARIPVGIFPVEVESPHHVAVSPDGRFLFVGIANTVAPGAAADGPHGSHGTGAADGYLLKIDARTGRQLARVRVERSPGDIRRQPGSMRIWQSHFDLVTVAEVLGAPLYDQEKDYEKTWSAVVVTDGETLERIARVDICPAGHGIGFAPDGSEAYVSCGLSDEIAIVDTGDFSVRRVPIAPDAGILFDSRYEPYALTVAPDGRIWVSNQHNVPNSPTGPRDNRGIVVIDPKTDTVIESLAIDTEGTPLFGSFTADGDRFYVAEQAPDRLLVIDPAAATIVQAIELAPLGCLNAHTAVLSPDETALWVVCEGNRVSEPGTLERFDVATLEHTGRVVLGLFPDDVAFVPEIR